MKRKPLLKTAGVIIITGGALMVEYGSLLSKFAENGARDLVIQKALKGESYITTSEQQSIVDQAYQKAGFITGVTALALATCGYFYQDDIIQLLGWNDLG